jgi:tetratricopeptide (TPR) repeat protein
MMATDPSNVDHQLAAAVGHMSVGRMREALGDAPRSLENFRKALALAQPTATGDPPYPRAQRVLSWADFSGAAAHQREAFAIRQTILAADPTNAQARRDLAVSHLLLAEALALVDNRVEAKKLLAQAVSMFERAAAADNESAGLRLDLTLTYHTAAKTLLSAGDPAAAIHMAERAVATGEAVAAGDSKDMHVRHELVEAYARLADGHAAVAAAPGTTAAERLRGWRQPRDAGRRVLAVLSVLESEASWWPPSGKSSPSSRREFQSGTPSSRVWRGRWERRGRTP